MIDNAVVISLVAIATLCTVVYIGLGFLPRPSRAAAWWSSAFIVFMLAGYVWIAADATGSTAVRAVASGIMLGAPGLIWAGLRIDRGMHPGARAWWPAAAWTLVAPVALLLTSDQPWFLTVVRVTFAGGGAFAALVVIELIRRGARWRDESLPLGLVSGGYVFLAMLNLFHEVVRLATGAAAEVALDDTRSLNILGSQLFVICAAFTLLLFTRGSDAAPPVDRTFASVARDRLTRAEAVGDRWWSVIVVRLDDPEALRVASSTNAFDHLSARFRDTVVRSLPADADLERRGDVEFVVLLPRPEGAVRQVLARLLSDVAATGEGSAVGVRPSASVGWAQVEVVGYDLGDLVEAADAAALRAHALGGDRWDRTTPPVS
ncbi:hypothetical protein [Microbacterium telephonicum]|uniref:GGDEF domain-containing protein n=1 Tax=Microbacterium telephonicum TaxID=1714841 RepID=A0A498C0N6_9MICO|nr:hypothetical protein [Microbacterium telephonicum]RLK48006.1 GGDEF domain-containing protein [Microbacterium telephonicum]